MRNHPRHHPHDGRRRRDLATTTLNTPIIPWALGGGEWGTSFVTYDAAGNTGVRMLTATNYDTIGDLVPANSGNNFRLASTGTATFSGNQTANSLLLDLTGQPANSNITLGGGGGSSSLTIASGALALVGQALSSSARTSTRPPSARWGP